jgi:excisionase family DNA binding protein
MREESTVGASTVRPIDESASLVPNPNRQIPDLMTVTEAACALSVSRRTVYRFDRENGPFKIIRRGRRVLIDRCTFNEYLSGRSFRTVDPVLEEPLAIEGPKSPDKREHEARPATETPASRSHRERTGCGQRELMMPYRWPMVVFYTYSTAAE